jgi:hypothetical protein
VQTPRPSRDNHPRVTDQLFLPVMANTLLHIRSVFRLPQLGQVAEPAVASEMGREISNVL